APADHTQPGSTIGTPRYIAPEQARGDQIDGRTDIYSLGVMAYELLVGRLPFESDNPMELIAKHITVEAPRPIELEPSIPPMIDDLLVDMLAKDPDHRPTLARVREILEQLRGQPAIPRGSMPGITSSAAVAATQPAHVPRRRNRVWLAGIAAGVIVIAVVIGWTLMRNGEITGVPAEQLNNTNNAATDPGPSPNKVTVPDTASVPKPSPPPAEVPPPVVEPVLEAQQQVAPPSRKQVKRGRLPNRSKLTPDEDAEVPPAPPPAIEPAPPPPEDPDALRKPTFKPKPK
ncbi:MAG TPA: protein kinase, partial [Kofleriaceae bacterium]